VFFVSLPLVFIFQNDRPWDSDIGDLSYPIYIGHWLALRTTVALMPKLGVTGAIPVTLACIASSLAFAIVLNLAVAQPIEKLRARVKKRRAAVAVTN
jgi:peptidoglycan/LPS O-acetylase OafA/YrhL